MSRRDSRYWTVQFRCVHTAENAFHSVSLIRTSRAGLFPNFTILPELGLRSCALPASTSFTEASETAGGFTKRTTG